MGYVLRFTATLFRSYSYRNKCRTRFFPFLFLSYSDIFSWCVDSSKVSCLLSIEMLGWWDLESQGTTAA